MKFLFFPLFKLLDDDSPTVQVEALTAISNVVLDFTPHKSYFRRHLQSMVLIIVVIGVAEFSHYQPW